MIKPTDVLQLAEAGSGDVSCRWCRVKKAYNPFEEDDDENEVDHPSDM